MPSDSEPLKVAIVEDTRETRESLALLINGSPGFRCVAACPTAEQALNQIPSLKPDVVLMDIGLPGMSGVECIQMLKTKLPSTQIIMLTILEDAEKIFQSLAAGATGYLLKKTPAAKLLEAITDAHQGGAPMTSQIARQVVESFKKHTPKAAPDTKLSPRENQVLDLLAQGFLYKEIGDRLGIAMGTVRVYIRSIYDKLHVHTRMEAVNKAFPQRPV
ncbi:MAG: response regulator transcription factor [Verrucomicrobia bacterium]|nr:response regulator transcription factor [Verrucomicrobiota bacterium]